MLRSFRVANHKSIRDEVELLLVPAYDKAKPTVPVAAIFGANASGKSNLLDALGWMRHAVADSYARWEVGSGVPRKPFRLDPAASVDPSLFVVDLLLDGVQFVYGFTTTDDRVNDEWLYSYPRRKKRVIFERAGDEVEFGSTVPDRRARSELLASFTRPNSLLLSAAVQAKQDEVMPVYQWFREHLRLVENARVVGGGVDRGRLSGERVARAVEDHPGFLELIRAADLGISDLTFVESDQDRRMAYDTMRELAYVETELAGITEPDRRAAFFAHRDHLTRRLAELKSARPRRELLILHGVNGVPLEVDEQSDGTLSWMAILVPSLEALSSGSVIVIDEIDASLHPRLTARLIELFKSDEVNASGAQLIFTTHDASLLGTSFGREVLGRDEVWFVEKDPKGATSLYPLSDFHPRKDENTERRYLGGSYGGVPALYSDTLVEAMKAAGGDGERGAA
jgi:predicted ATPase